jgi:hypothetical protein
MLPAPLPAPCAKLPALPIALSQSQIKAERLPAHCKSPATYQPPAFRARLSSPQSRISEQRECDETERKHETQHPLPAPCARPNVPSPTSPVPSPTSHTPSSPLQAPCSKLPAPSSLLQAPSYKLPAPSSLLKATRSPLPAPSSPLPAPSSPLQAPCSKLPAPSSLLQATRSPLPPPPLHFSHQCRHPIGLWDLVQ